MYPINSLTGVSSNGGIQTRMSQKTSPVAATTKLQANTFSGGVGGGSHSTTATTNWASQYQYYMTGMLPADPGMTDASSLKLFYRDIYLYDNVAGSAVDIQSSFPFSSFDLRGLSKEKLDVFEDAMSQLDILRMLPEISTSYLVDGFSCGSLVFEPSSKRFIDTLVHDALNCTLTPSPFFNMQPEIRVTPSQATQRFLSTDSPYTNAYKRSLPPGFLEMMRKGSFTLNPVNTLFIARRSLTDRAYVSFLHRILPMYLIEKTMFRGTLVEAGRRQR